MCERFGRVNAGVALVLDEGRLRLIVRRWRVFGIPLPVALAPRGDAHECADNGRFHFHVEIAHPNHRPDRQRSRRAGACRAMNGGQ